MPVPRREVQQCRSALVGGQGVGAPVHEQLGHPLLPGPRREVQRRRSVLVGGQEVGAPNDEETCNFEVSKSGCMAKKPVYTSPLYEGFRLEYGCKHPT